MVKISVILFLILFCSCNGKKTADFNDKTFEIFYIKTNEIKNEISLSSYIDSVKVINFKLPDEEILGRVEQVLLNDSLILLLEKSSSFYVFNRRGEFIRKIEHRGSGPGEYNTISDCFLYNDQIVVMDEALSKLLFYTLDGKYIKTIKYKNIARCIIPLNNEPEHFLCYTPDKMEANQYGLWIMDKEGNDLNNLLQFPDKYPIVSSGWRRLYNTSTGTVALRCADKNEVYYMEKDSLIPKYRFEIDKKTAEMFPNENMNLKESYYRVPIQIDTERWIWQIWGNPDEKDTFFALHDKMNGQTELFRQIRYDVGEAKFMGYPVFCNEPDIAAEIIYSDEIAMYSNSEKKSSQDPQISLQLLYFSK